VDLHIISSKRRHVIGLDIDRTLLDLADTAYAFAAVKSLAFPLRTGRSSPVQTHRLLAMALSSDGVKLHISAGKLNDRNRAKTTTTHVPGDERFELSGALSM
jgi:hypothetical protein